MTADEDSAAEAGGDKTAKAARGRRQKPPVTIDLAATEVEPQPVGEAETVAATHERSTQSTHQDRQAERQATGVAGGTPSRGFASLIVGAVGGLIVLLLGLAALTAGLVSLPGRQAADMVAAKVNDVAALAAGLDSRIAALEAKAGTLAEGDTGALSARVSALEESLKQAGARIETLVSAPVLPGAADAVAAKDSSPEIAGLTSELGGLNTRLSGLEAAAGSGAAAAAAVSALNAKVTVLDASLKTVSDRLAALAARPPAAAESERAARAVAVGVVRQAAEKGGPFAGDLAMLQTLGLDDAELAELQPLATKGAPSVVALRAEFGQVADAILAATSAAGPDAGFLDRVAAFGRNLVSVRPTAPIAGDSPAAVVSRMQAAIDQGDLATGLDEREALPESGKAASAGWAGAAADRVAIDRLVGKLAGSLTPPAN